MEEVHDVSRGKKSTITDAASRLLAWQRDVIQDSFVRIQGSSNAQHHRLSSGDACWTASWLPFFALESEPESRRGS